jgi:hypothetical protein
MTTLGPVFRKGNSYRARAEARQREYRARTLRVAHGVYGHLLARSAAAEGRNFVSPEAFAAAQERQRAGKGVAARTFENMLSSQAMCFNLFAPLSLRPALAAEALRPFIPGLGSVTAVWIEYTPPSDVFSDQSGRGGVDCDLLIEGRNTRGETLLLVVETKFVEPEFSTCGFRKAGRAEKGHEVCPDDVCVRADKSVCLYVSTKGYTYWQRTEEHAILAPDALPAAGCPFSGESWQLWVNLALAYEEARRRAATDVRFAVCASPNNESLLQGGVVLDEFRSLLQHPDRVHLIDLDALLRHVQTVAPPELGTWAMALSERYGDI